MERHHTTGEWMLPVFQAVEAFAPMAEQLPRVRRGYLSAELDATYTISVESGKLNVANSDAQGRVAGFVVHARRIRNVKLMRR